MFMGIKCKISLIQIMTLFGQTMILIMKRMLSQRSKWVSFCLQENTMRISTGNKTLVQSDLLSFEENLKTQDLFELEMKLRCSLRSFEDLFLLSDSKRKLTVILIEGKKQNTTAISRDVFTACSALEIILDIKTRTLANFQRSSTRRWWV